MLRSKLAHNISTNNKETYQAVNTGPTAAEPLSAFKTPYLNSSKWSEFQGTDWSGYESDQEHNGQYTNGERTWGSLYPDWAPSEEVPISVREIKKIVERLGDVFGFQHDNVRNVFDYLMKMLDSRAARATPNLALKSLHGDYIGGRGANFKSWYFAAEMDLDDADGPFLGKEPSSWRAFELAEKEWFRKHLTMSAEDRVVQISLYLLCWGEANNVRFMPECLCFIFKCCNDFYYSIHEAWEYEKPQLNFLDQVITPIYNAVRQQRYNVDSNGIFQSVDKDHCSIIGYDDMNQMFWYRQGLNKIVLRNKNKLMNVPNHQRYLALSEIVWEKSFLKTFKETRSWLHLFLDFNRVINIHLLIFWCCTVFNASPMYTKDYEINVDTKPSSPVMISVISLVGGIITFTNLISVVIEAGTVSRNWEGRRPVLRRLFALTSLLVMTTAPTLFLTVPLFLIANSTAKLLLALLHFAISAITVGYLTLASPATLFGSQIQDRRSLAGKYFTANYYHIKGANLLVSYGLWAGVFASKCVESYFFLSLAIRDPIRELTIMRIYCAGDNVLGSQLCQAQPFIILGLILILELVLFFLDTYLWYVIWNTLFSVFRSFYIGASIWTPWRNIYSRLPKRIYSKMIITSKSRKATHMTQVSKIWNSIVISMYREHFLSIEQVQKLLYQQALDGKIDFDMKEPTFFITQEDDTLKSGLFATNSEAWRRITFFALSLSTPMPDIKEIRSMPTFTVLVPHYGEKIVLSLREIIREEDKYSNLTMLEYLKQLYPSEWRNFVRDSRMMAEELDSTSSEESTCEDGHSSIPFQSIGFKVAKPEYIMRTRIWASLRSQTLYRTVSGFMNYSRAIKLLQDIESSKDVDESYDDSRLRNIHTMALRKFKMIVSMQRYQYFTEEEKECTEYLLRAYPELQIAYIEREIEPDTEKCSYYSCLIDGSCSLSSNGIRKPRYRIQLSGNPVLGDGKSDNQNHAVIFTRGEYIQLVDANQDNYLEECLKVRSILAEFDELIIADPYDDTMRNVGKAHPVAIIGTREYVFSENIGILGDVAAGKEQTFGTLYARTLAQIGGKLHYGHPDFLNSIFMTTRGGVSKAQKGLHLNEDIYAGMTAIMRGGIIKHSEFMQCGKGRDLGLTSILNFITKIGAGMGEQIISREYFFLGTQLPLDRFLSFYYAHAGFHLNNVFIILSIQLFLLVGINLAALTSESVLCKYDKHRPFTDPREPLNCLNLIPVIKWLERCIFSIFVAFLISFVPLGVQELMERGFYKALVRLSKHVLSLSSIFEIFVCKVYAHSLVRDLTVGGAQYIATGRGFATRREKFTEIFSRFGYVSLRPGIFYVLLLTYLSIHLWGLAYIYFWITILGFVVSPFLYNPNQLQFDAFFIDYLHFLRWMSFSNSKDSVSWIDFTKRERSQYTGVKKRLDPDSNGPKSIERVRPSRFNLLIADLLPQVSFATAITVAYLFVNVGPGVYYQPGTRAFVRILVISLTPLCVNAFLLFIVFIISTILGPLITLGFRHFHALLALLVHGLGILTHVINFEILWYLQNFNTSQTILAVCLMLLIQGCIIKLLTLVLSREFTREGADYSWWTGKWVAAGFKWRVFTQPLREGLCKFMEVQQFTADFFAGHAILYLQVPLLLIPLSNTWHSMMLFWLQPGEILRRRLLSRRMLRRKNLKLCLSIFIFVSGMACTVALLVVPSLLVKRHIVEVSGFMPPLLEAMKQPIFYDTRRKGVHRDLSYRKSSL